MKGIDNFVPEYLYLKTDCVIKAYKSLQPLLKIQESMLLVYCVSAASIWFEIWGVVDPGQKISIF